MLGHERDRLRVLHSSQGLRQVRHHTLRLVVGNPLAEIMEPAGVAVQLAVPVADPLELGLECGEAAFARARDAGEGERILYEGYAVELAQVDDERLGAWRVQRARGVRRADERLADTRHDLTDRQCVQSLLPRPGQPLLDDRRIAVRSRRGKRRVRSDHSLRGGRPLAGAPTTAQDRYRYRYRVRLHRCRPPFSVVYCHFPSFIIFMTSSTAALSSRSKPRSSSIAEFFTITSGATPKFSRLMP